MCLASAHVGTASGVRTQRGERRSAQQSGGDASTKMPSERCDQMDKTDREGRWTRQMDKTDRQGRWTRQMDKADGLGR